MNKMNQTFSPEADSSAQANLSSRLWRNKHVRIDDESSYADEVVFVTHLDVLDVDLVVLDLQTGGLSAIRAVRNSSPDCILIVLSENFAAPLRQHCQHLGADYFFDQKNDLLRFVRLLHSLENTQLGANRCV